MVKPVRMTMQEILSMWLDIGHKLQKHPPDEDKEQSDGKVVKVKEDEK